MKKTLVGFLLILVSCGIPRNKEGNIIGRIEYKNYYNQQATVTLNDGVWWHFTHVCNISPNEFSKINVGDIYVCKYKD